MGSRISWQFLGVLVVACSSACEPSLSDRCSMGGCEQERNGPIVVEGIPSPLTRFVRLTHSQWENATRDLLHLQEPSGLSTSFLGDSTRGFFDNRASGLSVGDALAGDYQRAVEFLAEQATRSDELIARLSPPNTNLAQRKQALIESLGLRAFRRPLQNQEKAALSALFDRGASFYPEDPAFAAGMRVVLESVLQSPNFLYRIELSDTPSASRIPLNGYEIASRLSFALWNSIPDESLLAAAADGSLVSADAKTTAPGVRAQLARMMQDPRARETVVRFHEQLLDVNSYADVSRSTNLFPEYSAALPAAMQEETRRFVGAVAYDENGSFRDLLTAPYTFANDALAKVYGLSGSFNSNFRKVELNPAQRSGLLTQAGFLSSQANSTETNPIHRGVFVIRRLLCDTLPPPPNVVPPLPAEDPSRPRTMRDRIDAHTGQGTCGANCHGTKINPAGFAFEHFDALGRWQEREKNLPINTASSYSFPSGLVAFDGATDFAEAMSDQISVHQCYAKHWLEYVYSRVPTAYDEALLNRLALSSLEGKLSARELLVELLSSPAFLSRSTEEFSLQSEAETP